MIITRENIPSRINMDFAKWGDDEESESHDELNLRGSQPRKQESFYIYFPYRFHFILFFLFHQIFL